MVTTIEIDKIQPNDFNPNTMSEKEYNKLRESIILTKGEYLKHNPILIRSINEDVPFEIIDGEHRWKACKELGFKAVPCETKDMSRREAQVLSVILGKNRGHPDYDKLAEIFWEHWRGKKNIHYLIDNKLVQPPGDLTKREIAEKFGYSEHLIGKVIKLKTLISSKVKQNYNYYSFSNYDKIQIAGVENPRLQELLLSNCFDKNGNRILGSKDLKNIVKHYNDIWKMIYGFFPGNFNAQNSIIDWVVTNNILDRTKIKDKIVAKMNEEDIKTDKFKISQTPSSIDHGLTKPIQVVPSTVKTLVDPDKILHQSIMKEVHQEEPIESTIKQELKRLLSPDEFLMLLQWAHDEKISIEDLAIRTLKQFIKDRAEGKIQTANSD